MKILFRDSKKKLTEIERLPIVSLEKDECRIGTRVLKVSVGNWAFYVPKLQLKLLHAADGAQHSIHKSAPSRAVALSGASFVTKPVYTPADWRAAFEKPVMQRAAENIVSAERLHAAGLGPAVLGYCVVKEFQPWYSEPTITAGYFVQNLKWVVPKKQTTQDDLLRAGVSPDRIGSCLREQIRGYVSDLNSVVGVLPIDADEEVAGVRSKLEQALG